MKQDLEMKWVENVNRAKDLVSLRKKNQMIIAALALEVCEISWGGNRVTDGRYTIKRFAEEIGMTGKALSQWIVVKRNVFDKLSFEDQSKASFTQFSHVALRVKKDFTEKEVKRIFNEVVNDNDYENRIARYMHHIRSLANNFENQQAARKVSQNICEEAMFYCRVITRNIKKQYPDIKGIDHNIAGATSIKDLSCASSAFELPRNTTNKVYVSDMGERVALTPKDLLIVNYMKRNKRFLTPTELGVKLGKHSPSSATAWSCRTLYKLMSLNMVERNNHGHYRWSNA
jgi:hypothetical protein